MILVICLFIIRKYPIRKVVFMIRLRHKVILKFTNVDGLLYLVWGGRDAQMSRIAAPNILRPPARNVSISLSGRVCFLDEN